MRYLIDTNILVFALTDRSKIDNDVTSILQNYENTIYISSLSMFEAIHLYQSRDFKSKFKTVNDYVNAIEDEFGAKILHTKPEHISAFSKLHTVKNHSDPVDRIIIAQSITEKIPLISSDLKFKEYKGLDLIFNRK